MSIVIKNLSFSYSRKSPYEKKALDNVNLQINDGDFVGIIGHTGSGKSTFI
ncbi:MAG: ATP-binding cassette domain-containing protein, partial [Clostridia bacterium]